MIYPAIFLLLSAFAARKPSRCLGQWNLANTPFQVPACPAAVEAVSVTAYKYIVAGVKRRSPAAALAFIIFPAALTPQMSQLPITDL